MSRCSSLVLILMAACEQTPAPVAPSAPTPAIETPPQVAEPVAPPVVVEPAKPAIAVKPTPANPTPVAPKPDDDDAPFRPMSRAGVKWKGKPPTVRVTQKPAPKPPADAGTTEP